MESGSKRMSGKKRRAELNRIAQRPHALLEVMRRNEFHPRDTCRCTLAPPNENGERLWVDTPACPLHGGPSLNITHTIAAQVPQGEVWIEIHGVYHDDLFRVAVSDAGQEVAEAREQYRQKYPRQNAVISITRMLPPEP